MHTNSDISTFLLPSVEQTRSCELHTMENEPIASIDLMERAGTRCAEQIANLIQQSKFQHIYVFCGTGNNGGDGLVIARHLFHMEQTANMCISVVICQSEQPHYSSEMETNLNRWKEIEMTSDRAHCSIFQPEEPIEIRPNSLIVDAIFGIGLNKPAVGTHAAAIQHINNSEAFTVAIDTPSGLFCDTHTSHENAIVMADVTLAIQYQKLAFLLAENYPFCGKVETIDIQMLPPTNMQCDRELLHLQNIAHMLKANNPYAHKGTFGHGLLIAGSASMPGAAILSATAALRGGIGKLTVHTAGLAAQAIPLSLPEAILHRDKDDNVVSELDWKTLPTSINAIAMGPGLGTDRKTINLIKDVLDTIQAPIILDADALNMLADNKTWLAYLPKYSILTPHFKEFERLAGPCENDFDRLEKAKTFAQRYEVVLILKGHHSVISLPDGTQFFNTTGNYGMATAGSGDVLTGLLLALLSQGYNPIETALLGTFIHGLAGDIYCEDQSAHSLIASDLTLNFGKAFKLLENYIF